MDAATALKIAGLEPIAGAEEGLVLLNGTQASTAFALEGLFHAEDLYAGAITIGAMSVEAALAAAGRSMPASTRCAVSAARSTRPPATATAGGWQRDRHVPPQLREGAGSLLLRCQPQVMGACLTQIRQAAEVLVCEANAVSDNPLVFAEDEIISGGNFHAEPVAFAADNLALAIAEIARCPSGAWRC
jgi:histidine ammonia-lyase